jgi:CheY-like chemotaxis protein
MIEFESIPNDELLNVNGSPIHLFKALMNLVTNAAEAMPSGGKIAVSSYNRYMDKTMQAYEEIPEGEYVCLSFEDNGVGISKDDLHKIFEPFYTKKKMGRSGTGLGMAIIWATVKDLCGYVDVKSKEGEGTIIDIYLPATRDSVEEEVHRVVLEDYLGTENIMVIDDVLEQREIAINMLTKLGYHVSSADSGEIALGLIKDNPVELVILDMIMPNGMDGLDTYRNIMTLFPGQKAIVASGFSESDRVKELKKLGVSTYVQKPYTLEKIGVAVRAELDRK